MSGNASRGPPDGISAAPPFAHLPPENRGFSQPLTHGISGTLVGLPVCCKTGTNRRPYNPQPPPPRQAPTRAGGWRTLAHAPQVSASYGRRNYIKHVKVEHLRRVVSP